MDRIARDVGTIGETLFEHLCSIAKVHFNKSLRDKTGWDYFIEGPLEDSFYLPIDMQPPPFSALVQVKSTDSNSKSVQIRLSNLLRLTNQSMPVFIVVFDFSKDNKPRRIFVVHLGEELIKRTLFRIRELQARGASQINRNFLSVPLVQADRLPGETSAENLFLEIKKRIGRKFSEYSGWKRALVESVGFNDDSHIANISFESESDPLADLVDLMLGLKSNIALTSMRMMSTRFDIPINHPRPEGPAKLYVEPKSEGRCSLLFEHPTRDAIQIDGDYFLPGIPNLPPDYRKMRIKAGPIDLVLSLRKSANISANIKFSAKERFELGQISLLFRVLSYLTDEGLDLTVETESARLFHGSIERAAIDGDIDWTRSACALEILSEVDSQFEKKLFLSVEGAISQMRHIENLTKVFRVEIEKFKVEVVSDTERLSEDLNNKPIACLIAVPVLVADEYCVLFSILSGTAVNTRGGYIEAICTAGEALKCSTYAARADGLSMLVNREIEELLPNSSKQLRALNPDISIG